MEVNSDHVEIFESMNEKIKSDEVITDLELEVKIEETDETGKIKTKVFEETDYSEPVQIIGEKRKSQERSNLENEDKKIKEEFVVYEELDNKQEPQEVEEINNDGFDYQAVYSDENDLYIGENSIEIDTFQHTKSLRTHANSALPKTLPKKKIKCKLLKILTNNRRVPKFYFEMNEKFYFYGYRGITADYKIILYCSKGNCGNYATITTSEFLKKIIRNSPEGSKSPKTFVDTSDPKVYDMNNYEINSFEIYGAHKCPGIEPDHKKCKLLNIANNRGHPSFCFEINKIFYVYSYRGIKADYRIVLVCKDTRCGNSATLVPLEFLKGIIQNFSKSSKYEKSFVDKWDPKIYDMQNYDTNSFEICGAHKCSGIELEKYMKKFDPEVPEKFNCKLEKIVQGKITGVPNFHFKINGRIYVYGYRGIRADYEVVLVCHKKHCGTYANITALEFLREIIQNSSKGSHYVKSFVDTSDPKIYDMKNYDINSFSICRAHKCPGIEPDQNKFEYKLVNIAKGKSNGLNTQVVNFDFEINGKFYVYRFRGIRANYKIALGCIEKYCLKSATITASEVLKEIIQNSPKGCQYVKSFVDKSDPKVYDMKNYDISSFVTCGAHKCLGMHIDTYVKHCYNRGFGT